MSSNVGDKTYDNLIKDVYSAADTLSSTQDSIILHEPLSFVRGGYMNYISPPYWNRGSQGYYWTSRIMQGRAVRMYFDKSELTTYERHASRTGMSLRCVSRDLKSILFFLFLW